MYVGMDVYFYHAGDTTKNPFPAKIMAINGAGALNLIVFGSGIAQKENVYHKDSTEFAKRPLLLRSQGCWDHVPYLPKFERPAPVPEDTKTDPKKK